MTAEEKDLVKDTDYWYILLSVFIYLQKMLFILLFTEHYVVNMQRYIQSITVFGLLLRIIIISYIWIMDDT